ncbi:M24 family metallopeptidase [Microcoleus sp. FACHB-1515]|uniref:M24 family metallopeptidase n=1 Tax=Cyanophyceae TaxID=3028117 RepID=UPI00168914C7|nr:M24 family metallopeptidase [Microcoleus sp. FACHB-1515]MBD2088674.1 M24 family metallopeptidase [Microcoleus sp. FACHB-1515]
MTTPSAEISHKLDRMREALDETSAAAIRLRGTDWFAWATAGASNSVLLAAETGVAEVFVTAQNAWILTDEIEAQRLIDEQLSADFQLQVNPWAEFAKREIFVQKTTGGGTILSDRPTAGEAALPTTLLHQKRILLPSEIDRYRQVGRLATEAMTEAMSQAQPTWTEYELAGAGAAAMWSRGLHPALTLVAGERRLPLYRHPLPTAATIGQMAMMVFCARKSGLYANLTRFICFGSLPDEQVKLHEKVREIEAVALNRSQPNATLNSVYGSIAQAYEQCGFPQAIREHHQGGTTGYLAREVVANPQINDALMAGMAIAWNPSLPGAKIEDTFIIQADGTLENLTFDPNWISVNVEGRDRPIPLELD